MAQVSLLIECFVLQMRFSFSGVIFLQAKVSPTLCLNLSCLHSTHIYENQKDNSQNGKNKKGLSLVSLGILISVVD